MATLSQSLAVAMDYLERTGQVDSHWEVEGRAARAIVAAWNAGVRHPIRLTNCGIRAVECQQVGPELKSFYPRVS